MPSIQIEFKASDKRGPGRGAPAFEWELFVVMSQATSSPISLRPGRSGGPVDVWERVWRYRPSDERDDALLAREQSGQRWRLVVDRLEAAFGTVRGLRTIELGSGRGDLSVLLARSGAVVTLLDQHAGVLAEAERRFDRLGLPVRCVRGDLFEGPGHHVAECDVAVSLGVIEHFRGTARTRAVAAHLQAVRPGGMVIISVPHAWCLPYRLWKLEKELRGTWPYGMEIPYSRRELRSRAQQAGLERIESHTFGFRHSLQSHWVRRWIPAAADGFQRTSRFDSLMGFVLLMFARRPGGVQRSEG